MSATPTPPTPQRCWDTDPIRRALLHAVADHLTRYEGHSPLDHFDDAPLIRFVQGLATTRRDRVPGSLHIAGLIAAVKAARSKTHLLTTASSVRLGVVIPTRGEAHRIHPTSPADAHDGKGGDGALPTKITQLEWLLDATRTRT